MKISLRRSALYMPAANSRALEKGRSLPADMLILDLEDSVSPDVRAEARVTVSEAIRRGGYGDREVILRINGKDTVDWKADLSVVAQCSPDAVLVPKINTAADVDAIVTDLNSVEKNVETSLWLMIETPASILNCQQIAACATRYPQLQGFVIGTNDLVKDTDLQPGQDRRYLIPWLLHIVAAAKAHGLAVLDGVFNDFSDGSGFSEEASQGRALGMTGKTLIHPQQIERCHRAFSPTDTEIAVAQRIVDAFAKEEAAGKGVINVDGKMVERLHLEMSKSLLARAKAIR